MKLIKTVKGYTAQARYYHANMVGGETGEWKQTGWTKLANGAVRPVYELTDGTQVVITDGSNHLTVLINAIDVEVVRQTEEECYS